MQNSLSLNKTAATPPSPLSGSKLALQIVMALSEALPRQNSSQPFSPEALEFMAGGLADIPADALTRAAAKARNSCRFMPTVAELRELSGMASATAEGIMRAEELAAWAAAESWVRRYGPRLRNHTTGVIEWADWRDYDALPWKRRPEPIKPLPIRIESALRSVGGPDAISRNWAEQDQHWLRDRFCEAYRLAPAVEDARGALGGGEGEVKRLVGGLTERMGIGGGR